MVAGTHLSFRLYVHCLYCCQLYL